PSYVPLQSDDGSLPIGYAKLEPGRGTLPRKLDQYRLATFDLRIFANSSRFCMYLITAFTYLFIATSPLRMPMPHGTFRHLSSGRTGRPTGPSPSSTGSSSRSPAPAPQST